MSDLERSHEAQLAARDETIAILRRENRMLHTLGNDAIKAMVDAIFTTAATGPLAAITTVMEWLVEHEMDVPWEDLDGDWLTKWRAVDA